MARRIMVSSESCSLAGVGGQWGVRGARWGEELTEGSDAGKLVAEGVALGVDPGVVVVDGVEGVGEAGTGGVEGWGGPCVVGHGGWICGRKDGIMAA
jgi:hypothetical protein